jgi:hypothetical protein
MPRPKNWGLADANLEDMNFFADLEDIMEAHDQGECQGYPLCPLCEED